MNVLAPALVAVAYLVSGTVPHTNLDISQRIAGGEKGILIMAGTTFPNATNTGVPTGTTLTPYTGPMTITEDGTVIDGKAINGSLRITADNVVIKNSKLTFSGSWGIDAYGAKNLTVQDSDIIGPGYAYGSDSAIAGTGNFLRNDISKVQNGITLNAGSSVVQGNYIHDLQSAGGDPHYDGIQAFGGHVNTKITGNTIISRDTSGLLISDLWGNNNGIEVRGNFFGGNPGYPIYVTGDHHSNDRGGTGSGTLNVVIEDNSIAKGVYDYFYIVDANPVIRNNTHLPQGSLPPIDTGTGGTDNSTGGIDTGGTDTGGTDTGDTDTGGTDTGGTDTGGTGTDDGVTGGTGNATVFTGTAANDVLPNGTASNAGNEKFYGLAGNDVLRGGAGADHLDGGTGTDTASYAGSSAAVNVRLDTMKASGGHATGDTLVSIENLTGSSHNDTLRGNSGANVLDGGGGADYMAGGQGNDTYVIDNAGDRIVENSRSGQDVVRSSISYNMVSNVEELVLTGSANINGTGNTGANVLRGNSGNNALNGHNGNDVIYGGLGNDVLTGGYGKDAFVFNTALNATNNVDRITDFSVVDDVIQLDDAVFAAIGDSLSSREFVKNTTGLAQDSNDHIIYETDTGKLFYDSNGSAAGGATHFATLNANLNLTSADFLVI